MPHRVAEKRLWRWRCSKLSAAWCIARVFTLKHEFHQMGAVFERRDQLVQDAAQFLKIGRAQATKENIVNLPLVGGGAAQGLAPAFGHPHSPPAPILLIGRLLE